MPHQVIERGHNANFGAGIVKGDLQVNGVGAHYTIAIGGAAPAAHLIAQGSVDTYHINGRTVSVVNTSPAGGGAPNLTINW